MLNGYYDSCKRIDEQIADASEIDRIMNDLTTKDLSCFKYNYALDDVVQNFSTY